ncbi:MAG: hypothetical protein WBW11_11975 [Pseudolabrys sp.]
MNLASIDLYKVPVLNCAVVSTCVKVLRLAVRVFWCAHRLPGRVVLPGRADRTGAVMPDLRETAILEDPLQGQEKGGAVFHLSLRLAAVHQE